MQTAITRKTAIIAKHANAEHAASVDMYSSYLFVWIWVYRFYFRPKRELCASPYNGFCPH